MRKHWRTLLAAAVLAAVGCGQTAVPTDSGPDLADAWVDAKPEVSAADLLKQPRRVLALRGADEAEKLHVQQRTRRENREDNGLLPDWRPTVAAPVLREARFSDRLE